MIRTKVIIYIVNDIGNRKQNNSFFKGKTTYFFYFQVEELKAKLPGFVKKYEKYKENRKRIKIFLLIKRRHKYFVIFTLFTCVVLAILAWRFCKKRNNKKK